MILPNAEQQPPGDDMTQVNTGVITGPNCPSVMTETTLLAWERIRDSALLHFARVITDYY